ncbi:hypothetical protein A3C91_03005 [Candidatus Azambacteria bacterium RIFCSPHIGHO2_02_FULL_52_12]|uniref:Band 7 domain-containing protein n=1 Tax=Candidatus Azambacteria bacterium RIFCSPLOWO2_01_FULL_46_25 TaxID=1797298 RepID=A0A1F5BU76_9BACT|nr:MAG: hypothetical protein A3C91_03005 [Candidatus Azambacteria bacterium RIFCSPHIGHO2_02_FULL_52_12]OGD34161.1 MAG: hypothetical protein A2988_01640 [Candidatus Azambacteria bacterium RIFCSPLOWO2_01_FULL_46_25]OGD36980.1 MAG: hypothetical protein A2850_00680 [Candidatus Azambacteria bacterium RIFCSPHIGHO2_01_FULL_51_74]
MGSTDPSAKTAQRRPGFPEREFDIANALARFGIYVVVTIVVSFLLLLVYRVVFLTFTDNYVTTYRYDLIGENKGKNTIVPRNGYVFAWPFIQKVHIVDKRPMQVCISAIQRVLNCKLVQFNPAGLDLFLAWHGRDDYENNGTRENPSQFNQILMAYAYEGSGKEYPFLTVIRELKPSEIGEALR